MEFEDGGLRRKRLCLDCVELLFIFFIFMCEKGGGSITELGVGKTGGTFGN